MDLERLTRSFRKQQSFAAEYSPLSACIFGMVADWLSQYDDKDRLVDWLLKASQGRDSLEVTLLLLAGLHRDILSRTPSVAALARYYPTVGGDLSCYHTQFGLDLREAIMSRRESLAAFIRSATVQTNETGRGIAWLLPVLYAAWDEVHLVDLGASVGLNLVADARAYRLIAAENEETLLDIGRGRPVQFAVLCQGEENRWLPAETRLPRIVTRTGCDLAPFKLHSVDDELTLAAFVWGDQPHRLERLREGIAALRRTNRNSVPLRLHAAKLPDELPDFLDKLVPARPPAPVVIYNTYMTAYLPDRGAGLRTRIEAWAGRQPRPVLWLQWEPPWDGPEPPEFGWCSWTADLWQDGKHSEWQLAWVHPHGTRVRWQPGLAEWITYWQQSVL